MAAHDLLLPRSLPRWLVIHAWSSEITDGYAAEWTMRQLREPARRIDQNAVRLQLHALAYNLSNFMRTLALPDAVEQWSLTSLREKLIKIGERRSCATGATSRSR